MVLGTVQWLHKHILPSFRPPPLSVRKRVTRPDGSKKYEVVRKYSWTCDLGPNGRRLRPSSISTFLGRTREEGGGTRDINSIAENSSTLDAMTTEGQVQRANRQGGLELNE